MTQASQNIFEWCDLMEPLLKRPPAEQPTQDSHKADTTEKLNSLQHRFDNELQEKSKHFQTETSQKTIVDLEEELTLTEKFYKNLKAKATKTFCNIGELMAQTGKIKLNMVTDEKTELGNQSTEKLIAK